MAAMQPGAPPVTTASNRWKLVAILAACGVFALGLLIVVIGAGAYFLTRAGQQAPAAQSAPAPPVPAGAPGPVGQPAPQVPPGPTAPAPGSGTFLTGHVYDADTGKAVILAFVAVLRPGTDPASDWGKQQGALLAIGGTTDDTGSFKTKEPVAKGARYPVVVFNVNSNVITQYVDIPAGAPDVMDLGTFRLKMSHAQEPAPASAAPQTMTRYADPQGRFSIDYPETWKLETYKGEDGSLLLVHGGQQQPAAVDLWTRPFTGGAQDAATRYEAAYRDNHPTARQVQGGPTQVGGRAAYYVYVTETRENVDLYEIHVYVPDGPQLYIVDGATWNRGTHVRDEFPVILQVVQSVRLR